MPASLSSKLSIRDVDLKGKKVVMRVDFNVPFDGEGNITNNQVRDSLSRFLSLAVSSLCAPVSPSARRVARFGPARTTRACTLERTRQRDNRWMTARRCNPVRRPPLSLRVDKLVS